MYWLYMGDLHGVPWGNLAHWHQKWRFIHPPVSNADHHERTLGQSNVAIENAPFIHDFPRYKAPLIRDVQIATFDFRRADQISWETMCLPYLSTTSCSSAWREGPYIYIYMQYGCGMAWVISPFHVAMAQMTHTQSNIGVSMWITYECNMKIS